MKWRFDKKCGIKNPLPDGKAAKCNPNGDDPCCDVELAQCSDNSKACLAKDTIDNWIGGRSEERDRAVMWLTFEVSLTPHVLMKTRGK